MFQIYISKLDNIERNRIYGASRIFLCQKPSGKLGRDYLYNKRGLDIETIAKFRLGYIPFNVDHDFAGRIVIPIFDAYDDLIALSVRPIFNIMNLIGGKSIVSIDPKIIGDKYHFIDEHEQNKMIDQSAVISIKDPDPKYWNESYPKGEHLFGLSLAKYSIAKMGFAIVVEGQFDVKAMHAHGFTNTVGVLGGAFTPLHALILKRWTSQIVFITDGDPAGREHALRAMDIMKVFEVLKAPTKSRSKDDYRFLKSCAVGLPKDNDPDTFLAKNGSYSMRRLIIDSMDTSNLVVPKEWKSKK